MAYHTVAAKTVSSAGAIYFVGPGLVFTRVVLRTVETELDGPTHRVPDLDAMRFSLMERTGAVTPAYMVVVHESQARALLAALEQGADHLPRQRLAVAYDDEATACAAFADICDDLLQRHVSLLPMNTNVTNWVRLLQVIQAGGHYVPPEILQARTQTAPSGQTGQTGQAHGPLGAVPEGPATQPAAPGSPPDASAKPRPATDGLTPREAEVLSMVAAGSPNKAIAGALALSEHTVKLYMHRIISKLGVTNRTEAAIWYHQHGQHDPRV